MVLRGNPLASAVAYVVCEARAVGDVGFSLVWAFCAASVVVARSVPAASFCVGASGRRVAGVVTGSACAVSGVEAS